SWWNRKAGVAQTGSVLLRGRFPFQPEHFAFLEQAGIQVTPAPGDKTTRWSARLEHPHWGQATLVAFREPPIPPRVLVDSDPRLTDEERALVRHCESSVGIACEARTGNVLTDRKDLLRFLHATLGPDGLAAMDDTAQAFWSRDGLADEVAHDAELDI